MRAFYQLIQPRIGGFTAAPGVPTPPGGSGGRDVLGGLGALASVADAFRARAAEDQLHSDQLRAVEHKGAYRRKIDEVLASHDPTADDYLERVDRGLAEAREGVFADLGISHDRVADQLELDIAGLQQAGLESAALGRRGALKDKALMLNQEEAQRALEMIRDDPDAAQLHIADFATTQENISPTIPPAELAALQAEFADQALEATIEGLATQKRFGEARELLDLAGGDISPTHRRSLSGIITGMENAAAHDLEMASSRQIADIDIAISDAVQVATLDQIRRHVETQDRLGLFEGRQEKRAGLISKINAKRAARIEDQKDLASAVVAAASGPLTQKEGDLLWPEVLKRVDDPAKLNDVLAQFVHDHGVVPTSIFERVEAAERAQDAGALAEAAGLWAVIADAAPNTGRDPGDRIAAVRTLTERFGLEPKEAAQRVLAHAPDSATRKQRLETYKDDHSDGGVEILDDLGIAPDVSWWWGRGYDLEGAPIVEAEELRREAFALTGDIDVANAMTAEAMTKRWGVSNIGGETRFMNLPPERYFPIDTIPNASSKNYRKGLPEEMRAQIMDELVHQRLDAAGWPAREGYQLIPTENARRRMKEGGLPEYYVYLEGPFGAGDLVQAREQVGGVSAPLIVRPPKFDELQASTTYQKHVEAQEKLRRAGGVVKKTVKETMELHPYSGWMQRRRAERKAREAQE